MKYLSTALIGLSLSMVACTETEHQNNKEQANNQLSIDTTASGLGIQFIRKGNGRPFEMGNKAIFFYRIKQPRLSNKVIDDNFNKTPLEMIIGEGNMIEGVEEAFTHLNVGDIVRLYIPAKIGYQEVRPNIPLGSDIIYEIELLGQKTTVPSFDTSGIKKQRTAMGVDYWLVKENPEGEFILPGKKVKVHYKGYFKDGSVFDSSMERGRPIEFTAGANQVILGWEEALTVLKTGEKATIFIPYQLAYGESGKGNIPPNTNLYFDITVISQQ